VIHSPSQSETQKRIESKSNPNLKKELAGLVGDAFAEAAKPRVPKVPSARAEAAGVGVFDEFWSAYPDCIYKTPNDPAAKLLAEKRNARLQRVMSDPAEQERLADSAGRVQSLRPPYTLGGQAIKP